MQICKWISYVCLADGIDGTNCWCWLSRPVNRLTDPVSWQSYLNVDDDVDDVDDQGNDDDDDDDVEGGGK